MAEKRKNKYIPVYIMIVIFIVSFSVTVAAGKLMNKTPTNDNSISDSDTLSAPTDIVSEPATDSDTSSVTDSATDTQIDSDSATESDAFFVTESIPDSEQPSELTEMLNSGGISYSNIKGTQLIIFNTRSVYADIYCYEKKQSGKWEQVAKYDDGFVGYWGISQSPAQSDKLTPSGLFDIGEAFGFDESIETSLDYFKLSDNSCWVTDKNSDKYNQHVADGSGDFSSYISMGTENSYKYGAVIKSNGGVSDFFLCCGTECTDRDAALSEEHLKEVLKWLDKRGQPQILIY